jgi:uncharacterized repeat protein (TIGR01451 family)
MNFIPRRLLWAAVLVLCGLCPVLGAGWKVLPGHVPKNVSSLTPKGRLAATNELRLAIGLPLRNQAGLDELLRQLYDPASTNYHKYLTPSEFTARFGPTEQDYQAVQNFAQTNGFTITATSGNRMLLDVTAPVAAAERAFRFTLRTYRHPTEARDFFAPDAAPTVDAGLPVSHIYGLNNYFIPRPASFIKQVVKPGASAVAPASGSGPSSLYLGNDFRAAYVPGTALNGGGQTVGLLELDGYYAGDIASYESLAKLPNIPLVNVLIDSYSGAAGANNVEVALDIDMAIAMATNLSSVIVYEAVNNGTTTPIRDMLNRMVSDNLARQISSSWLIGDISSYDTAYMQMAAQGQSFFQASGDDGAFYNGIAQSTDDTNVTLVGGTTLSTTGPGGAWLSEKVWNWNSTGQGTSASGGGVSLNNIPIPAWQQGIDMSANQGSTTLRNIPDVALTADNIFIYADNGTGYSIGGTSAAAPLWAGLTALINQQAAFSARPPVGFLNPALYAIGKGTNYALDFHDITAGNNTNTTVGNKYFAAPGYDLCTGWGTPNGASLINTLAPPAFFVAVTNAGWALQSESAAPANGAIDPGETVTVSFTLQNQGTLAPGNLVATLQPGAGVLAPGGPQTYGAVAAYGGSASQSFTFTAAGTCGSNIVANLQLQDGTNNLGTVGFTLTLGKTSGLSQNFDGVTVPALPSGWASANVSGTNNSWNTTTASNDTAPNAAFVSDSLSSGQNALVSPAVFISKTNAQLSFRQNYTLEYATSGYGANKTYTYYDGGVLEVQIGNGAFTDILAAGGNFAAGGYNSSITSASDNPLGGRSAWVGSSGRWKAVTVNLPASAAGQNIRLRWNCATDTGNSGGSAVGWYVDSISITDSVTTCLSVFTDLAASQSLDTNSLQSGQNLVYTLTVTNLGPQPAANVILTDSVPASAKFVSASPGYSYSAGQVVWPVGMLAASASTNLMLTLVPAGGNVFTNFVSVGTVTPEITLANNMAALVSTQAVMTLPPVISSVAANPDGSFSLQLTGSPNSVYILEATTNLFPPGNWLPIATNTLGTNGVWQFTDTSAPNFPQQFYRLELSH